MNVRINIKPRELKGLILTTIEVGTKHEDNNDVTFYVLANPDIERLGDEVPYASEKIGSTSRMKKRRSIEAHLNNLGQAVWSAVETQQGYYWDCLLKYMAFYGFEFSPNQKSYNVKEGFRIAKLRELEAPQEAIANDGQHKN